MMRILLGIFLLMSSTSWSASCATGTKAFYTLNNTYAENCGTGWALTGVGTVPFASNPAPNASTGSYVAGVFNDSNYLTSTAVTLSLTNAAYVLTEGYIYANSIANQPVFIAHTISGFNYWIQIVTGGTIKAQWGALAVGTTLTVSTGAWYYFAVQMTSGNANSKIWLFPWNAIGQTPGGTNNWNTVISTMGDLTIGRYPYGAGGYGLNGYLSNVRFSVVAAGTLPTTDPVVPEGTTLFQISPVQINTIQGTNPIKIP